jgi:hypothetical protein
MWDLDRRNAMAVSATMHCLTGCALGEVLGLLIGTAAELSNAATIALAVGLAFSFGYTLSTLPLLSAGVPPRTALTVVLAAFPVNRRLIDRGKGHALTHQFHSRHGNGQDTGHDTSPAPR